MTFEEAKKILEKEGFHIEKATRPCDISESFTEYEAPTICEAMQIVCSAGYFISMEMSRFNERKARLKKEYEKSTKAPGPGEDHPVEKSSSVPHTGLVYDQNFEVERLRQENKDLLKVIEKMEKGNPALKEASSQFNDALLDEQAKKIEELTKEKTNLEDQITILNACKEYNENFGRKQIKRLGKEIAKLNSIIHDKNAVLSDVAEELRLTKIREKNLAELGLKYVGENEKLKKELADKVVNKIDAQALKSAESALAYKEKVITDLTKKLKSINMNRHNERICKKQLAEKDEVIADLGNELAATKTELEEKTKLVEAVRKSSKEYCYYGIAAEKMIQKMADVIVYDRPVSSKEFEEYRRWANGYIYNPQLYDFIEEEEKKFSPVKDTHPTEDNPEEVRMNEILEHVRKVLEEGGTVSTSYDKAEEGGDQSATIVQCGNGIILSKEEAEIIERCTKNGTELHYSEKDGLTYTNIFGEEIPIRCLRGMFHVFTDEEIKNMKK